MMSKDLLAIYLTDHFAGAMAGSRRMRRLAVAERSAPDGDDLSRVADEVEQDRQTLARILDAANVSPRWYKTAGAWLAEAVGLLKTNGRLVRRSPLTGIVELEGMRMGVSGKIALWESLQHTRLSTEFDLDELVRRGHSQLSRLAAAHARRAPAVAQRETDLAAV